MIGITSEATARREPRAPTGPPQSLAGSLSGGSIGHPSVSLDPQRRTQPGRDQGQDHSLGATDLRTHEGIMKRERKRRRRPAAKEHGQGNDDQEDQRAVGAGIDVGA